ncbi:hypothetical protein K8O96_12195 [Clostridium sporogenes]|uniref:Uncharacterized protein n=2 Tax=Clostridium TaxID=1485 RepID=A0A6M0SV73_CLOBO|nr:hypothetical protein [Clostridium botulinum]NFI74632.1 hypothetical protein [Clostridium sporogenes]NFL71233.1 hypothetical protein [Clostridium sporogenes]NFM25396.1 hypothetical protein [Clostridium sporogenes]NFP62506.1 hypothetical protein [Clostridium sporogenes]
MIRITDEKYQVMSIHFIPFDPEYGLEKTKEELEANGGIFVTEIPKSERINGKYPIRYWNPKTQKIFYEYEDVPEHEEEIQEGRIEKLEKENKELENQLLLAENKNLGGIL